MADSIEEYQGKRTNRARWMPDCKFPKNYYSTIALEESGI
jgi:hypothetical protein